MVELQDFFQDLQSEAILKIPKATSLKPPEIVEAASVLRGQKYLRRNVFGATESKFGAARRTQRAGGYVNTSWYAKTAKSENDNKILCS